MATLGCEASSTMSPHPMGGNQIVRSGCDCQHQGGRELGLSGLTNTCESLINVVTKNKPKMLTGLGQKARGREQGFFSRSCRRHQYHRRKGGVCPTLVWTWNVVNQLSSSLRKADRKES